METKVALINPNSPSSTSPTSSLTTLKAESSAPKGMGEFGEIQDPSNSKVITPFDSVRKTVHRLVLQNSWKGFPASKHYDTLVKSLIDRQEKKQGKLSISKNTVTILGTKSNSRPSSRNNSAANLGSKPQPITLNTLNASSSSILVDSEKLGIS